MTNILNIIRVEHSAIIQILRILDQQVDEFNQGVSPNFDLINDSIDFLTSYFDAEDKNGEKTLFNTIKTDNSQLQDSIQEIDNTYSLLESSINELSSTLGKIAMDAFIPREWFTGQVQTVIDTFYRYIDLKESILMPAEYRSDVEKDWSDMKDFSLINPNKKNTNPLEQYRSSLYNNIIGSQA